MSNTVMRNNDDRANDTDIIPDGEVVIDPIVLDDANDHELDIVASVNNSNTAPTILKIKADGEFYEGQEVPDTSKNPVCEANVWHSIPIRGRASWHFKRVGETTVTIKGKIFTGSNS